MNDKAQRRPIIDPLLLLLKSRRVLVAGTSLLVGLLVMALPELEAVQSELLTLVLVLALGLIGGYSIEDAAAVGRAVRIGQPSQPENLRELIRSVVEVLLEEDRSHDE